MIYQTNGKNVKENILKSYQSKKVNSIERERNSENKVDKLIK